MEMSPDKLRDIFEETRKLHCTARKHIEMLFAQQEMLNIKLENNKKQLSSWSKEVDEREVLIKQWQKLEEEKQKYDLRKKELELASEARKEAYENVLRLVEEQKREKEVILKSIANLQGNLDEKQKLKMKIEELRGILEVMKHMGDDNDSAVQQKIDEIHKQLEEKKEEIEGIDDLNFHLLTKERQSNDELQDARKVLIEGLDLMTNSRVNIGVKMMGELDYMTFAKACKERYESDEADVKAAELCTFWEEKMTNAQWHPFRVIENDKGNAQKIVKEDDEELQRLKAEWGIEVYSAVTTTMLEMQEYNASGCYKVRELWNFKENRKVTLKEVIRYIYGQVKSAANKKRRRN